MTRTRADLLLVARGLADSRARARAAIEAGLVTAGGRVVTRPSELLDDTAAIVASAPFVWVSRGGLKLEAALDAFALSPQGRQALDVGASTGGFTDVLLARGAAHVVAVDVGRSQLHPRLQADPRVLSREGCDARSLTRDDLDGRVPDLVVADLSFIGLAKAIGPALALAAPSADFVALIKPQFEAGPSRVGKGGLVAPDVAATVADEVTADLDGLHGFALRAVAPSPVAGGDGNLEWLAWFARVEGALSSPSTTPAPA